jgi:hypothetical protein
MKLMARARETAAVARGAELLDATRPGWAGKLNLDKLELEIPNRCVLGQLYGGVPGS